MSARKVEVAIERITARRPDLEMVLQVVADFLTAGEGVSMIHQAAVQQFLWWKLPRQCPEEELPILIDGVAELLDELGMAHLARIARSDQTVAVLDAWAEGYDEGVKAFQKAYESSGVEPPDTDILAWGSIMGVDEATACDAVERALGEAIRAGELVPGTTRWRSKAQSICEKVLTDPLEFPPGQTLASLVITERVGSWVDPARHPVLKDWRSSVANRLLNPIPPPLDPSGAIAPVRWLLELASTKAGARLTASNYLEPVAVLDAVDRFGWWEFRGAPRSESEVGQLHDIRAIATRLRLVRRSGRRLHITKLGSQLLAEPERLWLTLATQIGENDEFTQMLAEVIGLRLLSGRVDVNELADEVSPMLAAQGWASSEGPLTRDYVSFALWGPLRWWRLLQALEEEKSTWERGTGRRLTPHTISLRPDGELIVLAYLRARAAGPRSDLYG